MKSVPVQRHSAFSILALVMGGSEPEPMSEAADASRAAAPAAPAAGARPAEAKAPKVDLGHLGGFAH